MAVDDCPAVRWHSIPAPGAATSHFCGAHWFIQKATAPPVYSPWNTFPDSSPFLSSCAVDPGGTQRWRHRLFKMTSASFPPLAATSVLASGWNCGFFQPKLREDSGQPWQTQHTSCLDLPMMDALFGLEKEEILKARLYLFSVFSLKIFFEMDI